MKNNPFSKLRNNLSFSPLRLFIIVNFIAALSLIFLIDTSYRPSFISKKPSYVDDEWIFLAEHLFDGTNKYAARYEDDIKIQLVGDTLRGDYKTVESIVAELKPLISAVNIGIVPDNGNLILEFGKTKYTRSTKDVLRSPTYSRIYKFEQVFGKEYYSNDTLKRYGDIQRIIVANLTELKKNITILNYTRSGNFLDPVSRDVIPYFSDWDRFVISKLYSRDFYQQIKDHLSKKAGWLAYYKFRYNTETRMFLFVSFLVFLLIYFGILSHFNVLKKISNWKFGGWFFSSFIIVQGFILASFFPIIDQLLDGYIVFLTRQSKLLIPDIINLFAHYYAIAIFLLFVINLLQNFITRRKLVRPDKYALSFIITLVSCWGLYAFILLNKNHGYLSVKYMPFFYFPNMEYILGKRAEILSWYIFSCFALTPFVRLFIDYTSYLNEQRILAKDLELSHLREANTRAELLALHARINPHFLYNALNSIAGLVRTDPERTEKVALSLSELFRHTLGRQSSQFIPLKEEVDMVEHYLEIEKIRFGNRMSYEIRLPDNLKDFVIPRFMVLPLVENAVKHGVSQIPGDAFVKVEIAKQERELRITVYDNGPGFPELLVGGSGLQNLQDMLHLLYDDDYEMQWQNKPEKYIRLVLRKEIQEKPGK